MAEKGVPLPTPDLDEIELIEALNEEPRANRMKLLEKMGQLPNHDEVERETKTPTKNTSTVNEAGEERGNDDHEDLRGWADSYDLARLLQGASDYISPNSAIAMEQDETVELPEHRSEHTTTHRSRELPKFSVIQHQWRR